MSFQKKTIWYCHHYAGSPSLGMSYRPYYLTLEFCRANYNAYVIGASYHHLQQRSEHQDEPIKFKNIDGVPFIRLKTTKYNRNGIGRILNMFSYVYRFYRHCDDIIAMTGRPDVIIVSSGHLFHYPVLEKIAKKYRAKLVFEVRDLWPLSLVELLKINRFNPLILWLSRIERRAYRNADLVVSVLDRSFPYMQKKGLDASKFQFIPNGVSVELFDTQRELPLEISLVIKRLKEEKCFILGYTGALGVPNAMEYLVLAMGLIAERKLPIHCVIVGDGILKLKLTQAVAQLGLTNITFIPAIPKYEIPTFLNQMDALYLGWLAADMYKFGVSPNKIFDYMMSGKPIIESGNVDDSLVNKFNCGLLCAPADVDAIADTIVAMYDKSNEQRDEMGSCGLKSVEKFYDYKILAQKYLALFTERG